MRARVLLVALGSALVMVGAPTGARLDGQPTVVVRSFANDAGQPLLAWEPSPGAVAVAFRDGTEAAEVVTASTITAWFDGVRTSSAHYRFEGLSRALRVRFGTSRAELASGLQNGEILEIPSPVYPGGWSHSFVGVDDFATHVAALAEVAPFPFRYPGSAVLRLRLADVSVLRLIHDPGFVLHFIYSSNPGALGAGDRQIVLDLATKRSAFGSSDLTFLLRGGPKIVAGGLVAVQINEAQIVFRLGARVLGSATAQTAITVAGRKTLLRSLRPPP